MRNLMGAFWILSCFIPGVGLAQSLGNAGTIQGTVADPSGAVIPGATVTLRNALTGYIQTVSSGVDGSFRLVNIPPGADRLEITSTGFNPFSQTVEIRNSVPIQIKATLTLGQATTTVTVQGAADAIENVPTDHVDVDQSQLAKLPVSDPAAGLSEAITYNTGGVAADANGFFHPLGDHAQVSFVIDGQPISDQQSKLFSTQLPTSAVQNMQETTGSPAAEFGDKSSLVAEITTRSGLGAGKVFGNVDATYGNFGTAGGDVALGYGTARWGEFITLDGIRTGHFLDTPEFTPFHDVGNNESIFDRIDFQPSGSDAFHLNLFTARSWFQIPNDYDQLGQDQRQRILTWNIAPGYQHTFTAHTLLTINPYVRKDQVDYYGSRDPFADTPATQSESRQLLNYGVRADMATATSHHNIKYGIDLKQTRLLENFGFGVTDATFNSPCLDSSNAPVGDVSLTSPSQCAAFGYQPNVSANPNASNPFLPGLLPYDLTRGGSLFNFHATGNINQAAAYIQDTITLGNFVLSPGFRLDQYDGLTKATGPQPRMGVSYNVKPTSTILRVAYARTFETPFNENLLLSNATGTGGLATTVFGSATAPLQPGFRNEFNTGFEQALGKIFILDVDYFWKYTHNAFDFNTLLNTTITFPIAWHNSKVDGVTGSLRTTTIHGFQADWNFGHTRARYFPPEVGGLIPYNSNQEGVFRIDHDQAFESTLMARYQRPKDEEWISFTYRFDSGMVVSGVPDAGAAFALTPNQQVTIGLACNGVYATVAAPLTSCMNPNGTMGNVTSKLLTLPQGGYAGFPSQENDDHNPDRVKPRNVFDIGIGSDNLFHSEKKRHMTASLTVSNVTNAVALYNFLSTFSGTHFLAPRTYTLRIGLVF